MNELIKLIENKKGGKINVDYEQGLDDCIDIIKEYQEEQLRIGGVVGRSEQFYCKDESYHKIERCTKQCSDCLNFVNNLQ